MAKRPVVVADDEQPIIVPAPTPEELEDGAAASIRRFEKKYGAQFPRLVAAMKAKAIKESE